MKCKFIDHGLQIYYSGAVQPCCAMQTDQAYQKINHVNKIDVTTWHQSFFVSQIRNQLEQNKWPLECSNCEKIESQNRGDSARLNSENAYAHYKPDDITLEIRPGNTCNFACQTCWPQASSRVANYYQKSGIPFDDEKIGDWNFETIAPLLPRIRDIIILGGEPFYDKKCVKFMHWLMAQPHSANVTIFTNGSMVDIAFLAEYRRPITLVFSLDACDRPAEYIRVGTDWNTVLANYQKCKSINNVKVRVNVTTSPYNYPYLAALLDMLCQDWPEVVSWGLASQHKNSRFMSESVIPIAYRNQVREYLEPGLDTITRAHIEQNQKINAINAVQSIIHNLQTVSYDESAHRHMVDFVQTMDNVKNLQIFDYCPEVADYLGISRARLHKDSSTFLMSDINISRS